MNITEGKMLWNEFVSVIQKYPYLSKDKKCDVVVIGAGIGGALTAFMQAKSGANVIVVDKNIIGYGSTMKMNGTMLSRIDTDTKALKNLGEKNISKCNTLCSQALEDIKEIIEEIIKDEECKEYIDKLQFKNMDLMCFSDRITNKIGMYRTFEKLGKENNNIEYLEEDPLINLRTGIIFPKSAAIVNPYVFTQLIFKYLSKMDNVEIYENTNVTNISNKEDVVECLTNNRFKIFSKCVVLTNGIHALKYIRNENISLNKTFSIATEKIKTLDESITDIVAKDIAYPNITIAFTKDNRIILTGEDEKQNNRIINDTYAINYANGKYKKMYLIYKRMLNIHEGVKIANCFSGMYLDTKDSLPIIDELDYLPNVYCNLGTGKNGIIFSMVGAKMLKDITKQYNIKDMYLFRENRQNTRNRQ